MRERKEALNVITEKKAIEESKEEEMNSIIKENQKLVD
jgi:hypothetical protein